MELLIPTPGMLPRAATPVPPERRRSVDAYADVLVCEAGAAWVVHSSAGDHYEGMVGTEQDGWTAARDAVAHLALDQEVWMYSSDAGFIDSVTSMRGVLAFPCPMGRHSPLREQVRNRARAITLAALPKVIHEPRIVAVDGSFGRGRRVGGYAYLTEQGDFDAGARRMGSSDVAELYAIDLALRQVSGPHLVLWSDSEVAIAVAQGHMEPFPGAIKIAERIRQALAERDATFRWVRAHAGAGLHDGADRLARAFRRAHQEGFKPPAHVMANIVAESLQAHRDECRV